MVHAHITPYIYIRAHTHIHTQTHTVMVRDVLHAYRPAARIRDCKGRIPLHLACMNESYSSVSMVTQLLREHPEGAMCLDDEGNLPLHLCLMHNHGDGAYEIVCMLLATYPAAARTPLGKTRSLGQLWQEYPAELVLRNTSCHAARIATLILNAYPDVLAFVDRSHASLLHRFVLIQCQNHLDLT